MVPLPSCVLPGLAHRANNFVRGVYSDNNLKLHKRGKLMRFKVLKFNTNFLISIFLSLAKLFFQIDDITCTSHKCSPGLAHKMMPFKIDRADLTNIRTGLKESFKHWATSADLHLNCLWLASEGNLTLQFL